MKQTWFVIVANPQEQVAWDLLYAQMRPQPYALERGSVSSFTDAQEFADENCIALNAQTYIDLIIRVG